MGMLGTIVKGALAGGVINRLMGKQRRGRFGRRAGFGGFGRRSSFGMRRAGMGGLAAPVLIGVGGWAFRKWQQNRQMNSGQLHGRPYVDSSEHTIQ